MRQYVVSPLIEFPYWEISILCPPYCALQCSFLQPSVPSKDTHTLAFFTYYGTCVTVKDLSMPPLSRVDHRGTGKG